MRDADVRAALVLDIEKRHAGRRYLLVPEVDVRWSVPARIDALMIADRLTAFEIKSQSDSLARFPRQVSAYEAVAERAALVLTARHVASGLRMAPDWWSVWLAENSSGQVKLRRIRGGALNPSVNPLAVLSFMPRDALVAALRQVGERDATRLPVDSMRIRLADAVPRPMLMRIARSAMLARNDWRRRALLPRIEQRECELSKDHKVPGGGGGGGLASWRATREK
ncbi:sce7726 family protein [Xylanimonas oleitrophica]|uniref:sce7726 family protein n=1 Tax=Xylanimonas oleitrophica TaxID=2607479 RepID=UPI0011B75E54